MTNKESILNQTGKRKARILVVDDDPGLLRLLTIRLRAESYDVEAVESAAQALAASSRFRPDLVITDLRMDQMDGIGLLKELQNRWPGLKVIILTAHGTIPDAVKATQSGAFGFLTKPVEKQELLDQVANTVSRAENLWLTSMKKSGTTVTFEGSAASINSVANFITALKRSGYFQKIEIKESKQDDKNTVQTFLFTINAEIAPNGPAAGAPAQAKPANSPAQSAPPSAAPAKKG